MKKLLLIACFLTGIIANAQTGYPTLRNNGINQTQEEYLINSPGNMIGNSRVIRRAKDSTYYEFVVSDMYFRNLVDTLDQPGAINFIFTDHTGRLKSSGLFRIFPDTLNVFPTFSYLNANYYNKAQSDMRYIQNIAIDSQMVVNAVSPALWASIINKSYHILLDTPNLSIYATNSRVNDSIWAHETAINGKLDYRYIPANIDSSNINELQTLSGSNRTISLNNGGGSYTIPQVVYDSIINTPTIPPAGNIIGGQNIKITGSWPNIMVADSTTIRVYNSSGIVNQPIKIWTGIVTPSSSSNYSMDISSAGFSTILSVNLTAYENVSTEKGAIVSGKLRSTSAITMNIYRSKNTGVLIGGNVEGLELHPTPANVTISAIVIGY